ncbi:MAG TPA: response regulator [Lichenihabitans sp.]|jgi:DNA-binding NarL/FixJ family response regulator|nr:response regulator [Lichenihabitans sp.]
MSDAEPAARLKGKKVLIVEDETLISMLFEDILSDLACEVVGPALTIRQAMDLARAAEIDVAVLDVNVAGDPIWPVAEILAVRGIPMVFSSGYGSNGLPERWRNSPSLPKPFTFHEVAEVIDKVLEG